MKKPRIQFKNYSIPSLLDLKDRIDNYIHLHKDGNIYICIVRSFGSCYEEHFTNIYACQELCNNFNGDNGFVDVYTTNKNPDIWTSGGTFYIESYNDFEEWEKWRKSMNLYEGFIDDWNKYDAWVKKHGDGVLKDIWSGNHRPYTPHIPRKDVEKLVKDLKNTKIKKPIRILMDVSADNEVCEGDI